MLILRRELGAETVITCACGQVVRVVVHEIRRQYGTGGWVRLGFDAPKCVRIDRGEPPPEK